MENQGRYDCAVFGEGLAGMVAALLLSRQGERVILVPEPKSRVRDSRLQFGMEEGGILYGFLRRWGLTEDQLKNPSTQNAQVEIISSKMALSLRQDLASTSLGSPSYEVSDEVSKSLWSMLQEIEKDGHWMKQFESEFLKGLVREKKGWRRYAFIPRSASRVWGRSLRKALGQRLKSSKLSALRRVHEVEENTRRHELLQGTAFLMGPGRFRIVSGKFPLLQSLLEIYALRRTPFAYKNGEQLKEKLRQVLKQQGVVFVKDGESVHFKRDSSGEWEGFFGGAKEGALVHFKFAHFIFAHSLNARTLSLFEESARKTLEKELQGDPCVHIRWRAVVPSLALPYAAGAELVTLGENDAPIRISIYGRDDGMELKEGESLIEATAWLPLASDKKSDELEGLRSKLKPRMEREILKAFPGLDSSALASVQFECERLRDFLPRTGVKSHDRAIWHVNHTSFPSLGEFGPFVAGIELARQFAKRNGSELRL